MFSQNLSLLKQHEPELFHHLKHYKPKRIKEQSKPYHDLLVESEPFYGSEAKNACYMQVSAFMERPLFYHSNYMTNKVIQGQHQIVINSLNKKFEEIIKGKDANHIKNTTFIILGSAFGFHIEQLIQETDIKNIILIEPDDDMLFYFMNNISIKKIMDYCQEKNGVFSIIQANNREALDHHILYLAQKTGFSIFSNIGLFRHYQTEFFDNIFNNFKAIKNQWLSSWGNFDDEIKGFKNTLNNIFKNNKPLYENKYKKILPNNRPILIVGSGPSLDQDLQEIKKIQDQITIASCGSAIAALVRSGITPDIHFEMERDRETFEAVKPWLSPKVTNNTLLIALNTVDPGEVSLFKQSILFAKANDLGSHFISAHLQQSPKPLYFVNPTVTNFALAASIKLGWKEIIFSGCDCGYKDNEIHHSQLSDYFDENSKLHNTAFTAEIKVPGNFSGTVLSDKIYNLSRCNIEKLLKKNPDITAWNTSDGAFINGSTPIKASILFERLLSNNQDKASLPTFLKHLNEAKTSTLTNKPAYFKSTCNFLSNIITTIENSNSLSQLEKSLQDAGIAIETQLKDEISYLLLSGTLRIFQIMVSGHINKIPGKSNQEYLHTAKKEFTDYFCNCINTLNQLDEERKLYEIQHRRSITNHCHSISYG